MIKTLLSATFLTLTISGTAQITSLQSGNFGNPDTWSCGCVPTPTDDITISHSIVFTSDVHIGDAVVEIMQGGSLYGSGGAILIPEDGSTLVNRGGLNMSGMLLSGQANFTNESSGYVYITGTIVSSFSSAMQNAGSFTAYDLIQGGSFNNKGTASFDLIQCNGTLVNEEQGLLSVDSLHVSHQFHNYGHGIFQQVHNASGQVYTTGVMQVSEDVLNNGEFLLETGAQLTIGGAFTNENVLTILGQAGCEDFTSSGQLNGGGHGQLCILDQSANSGAVLYIAICDQTGNDFDVNTGSIGAGVVFCTNGNCAELGIEEQALNVALFPNPATDQFTVSAAVPVANVQIYSVSGSLLKFVSGSEASVDGFAPGMYFVGINGNGYGLQRLVVQ